MRKVRLESEPFDPALALAAFFKAHPGSGGICSFVGDVRGDGGVEALELTHYPAMTLPAMERLADRALERFALLGLLIVHRIGAMDVGEAIVCVAAASRHRRAAIEAVDFTMDHLKSASWLWKREKCADGWHWIAPREEDHGDLARWDIPPKKV